MKKIITAGFLGLLLFLAPSAARANLDQDKAAALALLTEKKYDLAYHRYLNLFRQEPQDFEINLMLARSARLAGKLNHANLAYERVIEAAPDEPLLRLEMAELLIRLGRNAEARSQLEEARRLDPELENGSLAAAAKGIDSFTGSWSLNGKLTGGVLYDSNMNNSPNSRSITLGGIPLELEGKNTARETFGSFFNAALEAAWRPTTDSDWWLVADVNGYQRWNLETSPRRDLTFGRAAMGLRHLTQTHLLEFKGKLETLLENEDTSVNILGGELNTVVLMHPDLQNLARAGYEYREDKQTRQRRGKYWFVSDHLRWFFGQDRHSLPIGLKLYGGNTKEKRYDYKAMEPSIYFNFVLPADFSLTTGLAYRLEAYDAPATVLEAADRTDKQVRLSVFLDKKINDSWSVNLGYQYTDNNSNSDLYEYDQHLLMSSITFKF